MTGVTPAYLDVMKNIAKQDELKYLEDYFRELFGDELDAPDPEVIADAAAMVDSDVRSMMGSDDLGVENAHKFTVEELMKQLEIGLGSEKNRQVGMLNTEYDTENGHTPWDPEFYGEEFRRKGRVAKLEFQEQQLDGQYALHEMMFSDKPGDEGNPDGVLIADGMGVGKTWCI